MFPGTPAFSTCQSDGLLKCNILWKILENIGLQNEEVEYVCQCLENLYKKLDYNGMGEYVTDYYHNTYERIVMFEKKYGESEISKELKNDMYMIRKMHGRTCDERFWKC